MNKPVAVELVICPNRFKKLTSGTPFFWGKKNKLWFKAATNTSAFCVETGEIKFVRPYTRVEEVVGML